MIAEAGLAALWMAAALALCQLALGGWRLRRGMPVSRMPWRRSRWCRRASWPIPLPDCVFMRSDMSVLLVAANSHSAKPMLYKIAGTWGNHEGSMLLWVTILGLAGATIALFERRLRADTKVATLAAQAAIALGFYAFLLFSSNPFTRIVGVIEGPGSIRCCRTPASPFIRPRSTPAMSACRRRFPSRSARSSPAMSGRTSPAPCGHGCWVHGCS